jgi:hypothetical protein
VHTRECGTLLALQQRGLGEDDQEQLRMHLRISTKLQSLRSYGFFLSLDGEDGLPLIDLWKGEWLLIGAATPISALVSHPFRSQSPEERFTHTRMWVETIAEIANMTPSTIRLAVAALLASLVQLPAPTTAALREQDPAKQTALDKYVAAPDDNFAWTEIPGSSWKGPGFVAHPLHPCIGIFALCRRGLQ